MTRQRANLGALVADESTMTLFRFLNEVGAALGQEYRESMLRGGADDAGTIQSAGVAVVDGCGIDGLNAHNLTEQAYLQSMYDKVLLLAAAILDSDRLEALLSKQS